MSHYIQDTQAVVKTADNKYLLWTKGGDNNVISCETGRHCSDWWMVAVFENVEDYNLFIDTVMTSDINGGSWQFASLKNKSFDGFTKYESLVYGRFNNAIKNPIETDWKLSEINEENVSEFETSLIPLFRNAKKSLKDGPSMAYPNIVSRYDKDDAYKKAVNRLNNFKKDFNKEFLSGYREFCDTYKNTPLKECFKSIDFCQSMAKYRESWNGISIILRNEIRFTKDTLSAFLTGQEEVLLNMWEREVNEILCTYPSELHEFFSSSKFVENAKSFANNLDDEDWRKKSIIKNLNSIVAFSEGGYKKLIAERETRLELLKEESPQKFINLWNDELLKSAYFKNTNVKVPRIMEELKSYREAGEFELSSIAEKCDESFKKLPLYYENQYKKNKAAIVTMANILISQYSELLSSKDVALLCSYFKIEKPQKAEEIKPIVPVQTQANKQGLLF